MSAAARNGNSRHGVPVRLDRLQKAYEGTLVVEDLSLSVEAGAFLTLLGPSGSGKTTTLMMIAGFVPNSGGEIYIDERPVGRVPPERRELGMVFQSYALFPHMTVGENIGFPLRMRRRPRAEIGRKVAAALEMVKLPGYEERMPRQLSGGQQQRVALARAIVFEPRVLLMDEPLGSLDKKLREHMQAEIKRIQKELDMTVIYVTHDQQEALSMSDQIAVMHNGRIQQVGPPAELYDEPVSTFVADFVGESNFVSGTATAIENDGTVEVRHQSGRIFRAHGHAAVTPGMPVVASIRPERLVLVSAADPGNGFNLWTGRIGEIVFLGDAVRYRILFGEVALTVKTQDREIGAQARIGDEIGVRWRPAHTALLDDPSAL